MAVLKGLALVFGATLGASGVLFIGPSAPAASPPPGEIHPVVLEGSHTLFPFARSLALAFQAELPGHELLVGGSGTAPAFAQLCAGTSDLATASRPIKKDEVDVCAKNHVDFIELPVAYDGVAVIVNPKNTWAKHITVVELKKLWGADADKTITKWSQVRAGWPDAPLELFGPEADSGTTDYFRDAVLGDGGPMRSDYKATMNGEALVEGVSGSQHALGLLGLSYYKRNAVVLRALAVDDGKADNGAGAVAPTTAAIGDGTYQPLARPLLVYVALKSLARPDVVKLLDLVFKRASTLTTQVGLVPLSDKTYKLARTRLNKKTIGSVFDGSGAMLGGSLDALMTRKVVAKRP